MTKSTARKWKRANRMMECAQRAVLPWCKCGSCKRTKGVGAPAKSMQWAMRMIGKKSPADIWLAPASLALDGCSIKELP